MPENHRDRHRERTWEERAGNVCPGCGRSFDDVDRADVHHWNGNDRDGAPDNLRKRCKDCHLEGEHDRDVDSPKTPPGPRRTRPPRPSRSAPR